MTGMLAQVEPISSVNSPVITLNHISLSYNHESQLIQALEDVQLELYEDDFICVLGPSGCGKSSLLNVIAGYLQPSTGSVVIDGQEHIKPDPQVGVVLLFRNGGIRSFCRIITSSIIRGNEAKSSHCEDIGNRSQSNFT